MERNISIITMVGAVNYDKTTYQFTDGKVSSETTIFSNALIEYYKDELKEVVFLGTETSSWSAILPNPESEEDRDFFDRLTNNEAIKPRSAISNEDFEKVRKKLKDYYPFDVHVLPPQKSNINLEENPLDVYSKIINYVKDTKIVFDITSAFRYMPLLIFESLQTYSPDFDVHDITLLYAERNENGKNYQVRDFSEIWRAAEINKVLYTFQMTLDGTKLATYLDRAGERKLAKYLKKFSENIQRGYMALCDYDFFESMREIIDSTDIESVSYSFVRRTMEFLDKEILSKFDYLESVPEERRRSWCLYTLAEILNHYGLYSQAIISLRESVYMRFMEKEDPSLIGRDQITPDDLKPLEKKQWPKMRKYQVFDEWIELKQYRNHGAHAGMELISKDDFEDSTEDFAKYQETVRIILSKAVL